MEETLFDSVIPRLQEKERYVKVDCFESKYENKLSITVPRNTECTMFISRTINCIRVAMT